ncbi:MAG: HTTM domain-containing protein [Actinomycetota bacterium]
MVTTTSRPTQRIGFWWNAPQRPTFLAVQRIAVAAYAVVFLGVRFGHIIRVRDFDDARFDPVGVVGAVVDRPVAGWLVVLAPTVAIVASLGVLLGWRYRLTAPLAALAVLWSLTYLHSWGVVLHTDNLLTLHLLVLAVLPAADALSLDVRRERVRRPPSPVYRWGLVALGLVTALTYVVAAWAKIRNGGLGWLDGDVLRSHVASDNLRKDLLGDPTSPIAGTLVGWSWLWAPMALGALVLELAAPLAVVVRRFALPVAIAAWTFHLAVLGIMAILFPYQLLGIALLPWVLAAREIESRPEDR